MTDINQELSRASALLARIETIVLGREITVFAAVDKKYGKRIYIQAKYWDRCRVTGVWSDWKGRKWYLSDHMTDDEIVKTAYAAFKAIVEHEVLEGFTVDGVVLFNPHASYEALLTVSSKEVRREQK